MDALLKEQLAEGESIIWQGVPEPFETLDKTNKKRFWITLAVCIAAAAALVVLYLANIKGEPKPAVLVIILVLCGFAPVRRFLYAAAVRKLRYLVTDRQLLIVSNEVKRVSLSRVKVCALRSDADGHLSFLAGAHALKARPSHWRDLALTGQPNTEPDEPVDSFAFYAVADKAGLRAVIRRVLPNVQM